MNKIRIEVLWALCLFFIFSLSPQASAADAIGGVSLGGTRVIFQADKGEAGITVNNTSVTPFLVQSWVGAFSPQGPQDKKFIVTPPLYRQEKGTMRLRIIPVAGDFDKDKESVFMLNVKTIPVSSKVKKGENVVQFAYLMKVKLFYRPSGLDGKSTDAFEKLTFSRSGNTLTVTNPSPYFVTFMDIFAGGSRVADVTHMVPPRGSQSYKLPAGAGNTIKYRTIDDFGGITAERTVSL